MGPRDITELVSLAMLWSGSFLFVRMGAAEIGPVVLSALRLVGASLLLLPLLLWRGQWTVDSGQWTVLRQHWRPISFVGVTNSSLPFVCFAYAALSISAGLMGIFNAATPLFSAVIAWWWLKGRLTSLRIAGLVIGFIGVAWLAWRGSGEEIANCQPGGSGWAVLACLATSLLYGFPANFTKRRLSGVATLAVEARQPTRCQSVPVHLGRVAVAITAPVRNRLAHGRRTRLRLRLRLRRHRLGLAAALPPHRQCRPGQ